MRILVDQLAPGGREENMGRVAVVFPAYNEERHVAEAVQAALGAGAQRVVCINDGSADATGSIIDRLSADPRVQAIRHEVNQGKQAAVKHGLQAAVRHEDCQAFAVLAADMQDDPALLPGLCHQVGPYDLVIGYRSRDDMPGIRRLANTLANVPYRWVAGIALHDIQSGYRIYTREVAEYLAEYLAVKGRYTIEHTSMLLCGRLAAERGRDFRIAEMPVPYSYEGTKSSIRLKDNIQLTWASLYHAATIAWLQRRTSHA